MKRETPGAWFYRIKTLPNRQPQFASGLCSMVCLWLVLIPGLILTLKGVEFPLHRLLLPSIGAIGLAILLFAKWKKVALQTVEQNYAPKSYSPEAIETRLNRLSTIAKSFQWISTLLIFVIVAGNRWVTANNSYHYSLAAQGFCILSFLFSFILSRVYIYARKRLEEVKHLSPEERTSLKFEYLGKYLWPHLFWAGAFAFFHWAIG